MEAMTSPSAAAGLPARLVVVRLGAIGDVANALVFAAAVKEARPDAHVGWVVHPLAAPLVEGHPCVSRTHVWRRAAGVGEFLRLVRELRAERYELAVDLQRLQKSAALARLSGAKRVLGFARALVKEASWIWTGERVAPPADAVHRVEHYLAAARHLGCEAREPRHLFPRDAAAERWAEALVAELGAAPVLVNLGASKPLNRWASERFGALARALVDELRVPVCLTGGPADRAAAERAQAACGGIARDLTGRTGLLELLELARRSRLFIGCDTGPLHLAAAVHTPVIALFGPADPARTGPWGREHRVLRAPPAGGRRARMEDIPVELVLAAARERLALVAT